LKLPKLDGVEVLEQIKKAPPLNRIPVVMLTTSEAEQDRARAYEHQVNSYLVKPLDFEQFKKLVNDMGYYWGVWNMPAPIEETIPPS
jgi:CheY-like chemotaxis protein